MAGTLLAASGGGHLTQLLRLSKRLPWPAEEVTWFTFDTAQSRSLLADQNVVFAEHAAPRDLRAAMRNRRRASKLVHRHDYDHAVSTGASIALSSLTVSAAHGVASYYVESAARVQGPSLTGRVLRRVPRVRTYCQYEEWADRGWAFAGSVFDEFSTREITNPPTPRRITVTVGSQEGYGFRALVERLVSILPPEVEVCWQTGFTDIAGLGIDGRPLIPAEELAELLEQSDVVVAHAGVGSALAAFDAGLCPVLVPRRKGRGEHVDDHQTEIAHRLSDRGLAVYAEVDRLSYDDVLRATHREVTTVSDPPPLMLR